MDEPIQIETLTGDAIDGALPALARLRIDVFSAFPYLYDGDGAYEQRYLEKLKGARDSIIVVARRAHEIVGCATGSALNESHAAFSAPLDAHGIQPASCFYCGESVLLPEARGLGIGHAFFDQREAHARARGYRRSCFCAVVRAADHPSRPVGYSPLDPFWVRRGYRPLEGAIAYFGWKDLGEAEETEKPMQVWVREFD